MSLMNYLKDKYGQTKDKVEELKDFVKNPYNTKRIVAGAAAIALSGAIILSGQYNNTTNNTPDVENSQEENNKIDFVEADTPNDVIGGIDIDIPVDKIEQEDGYENIVDPIYPTIPDIRTQEEMEESGYTSQDALDHLDYFCADLLKTMPAFVDMNEEHKAQISAQFESFTLAPIAFINSKTGKIEYRVPDLFLIQNDTNAYKMVVNFTGGIGEQQQDYHIVIDVPFQILYQLLVNNFSGRMKLVDANYILEHNLDPRSTKVDTIAIELAPEQELDRELFGKDYSKDDNLIEQNKIDYQARRKATIDFMWELYSIHVQGNEYNPDPNPSVEK